MARRKPVKPVAIIDPLDESKKQPVSFKKKTDKKSKALFRLTVVLSVVTGALVLFIVSAVVTQMADLEAVREEGRTLAAEKERLLEETTNDAEDEPPKEEVYTFDKAMSKINPEYVCWIKIEDTMVDFPVVRGDDNEKYLNLTFYGQENVYGSIFMDYRCAGTNVPHILIYGHNTKDGDMFGGLRNFLRKDYIEEHNVITLTVNDQVIEYEIFDARMTDIHDPAYNLYFEEPGAFAAFAEECGAPEDAKQIITLSTCVSGDDDDERVIVQGVLK
jgi:sortase B